MGCPLSSEGLGLLFCGEVLPDPVLDLAYTENSAGYAAADCSYAHSDHTARCTGDKAGRGSDHGSNRHAHERPCHMIQRIAAVHHFHFLHHNGRKTLSFPLL